MRKITIDELKNLAADARLAVWANAEEYDRDPKVYLHWTAGHYNSLGSDVEHGYHIAITGNGDIYLMNPLTKTTSGTWRRNTGAINVTLCGGYGAGSNGLGNEPPTSAQIEAMAQVVAVICKGLWLTPNKVHVLTHGEAANNEDGDWTCHNPYAWWNDSYGDGDTRGDLEYLGTEESPYYNPSATDGSRGGDVLRGKAMWYMNQGI